MSRANRLPRRFLGGTPRQVFGGPVACRLGRALEGAGLVEQVRREWHYLKPLLAVEQAIRFSIQLQHLGIGLGQLNTLASRCATTPTPVAQNRRFHDLITLRMVKAALAWRQLRYSVAESGVLAETCTALEDAVQKVERRMCRSEAALLFESHVGQRYDATSPALRN